jgi:hypothetical protein
VVGISAQATLLLQLGAIGATVLLIVGSVALGPQPLMGAGLGVGIAGALTSLWFTALAVHDRHLDGHLEVGLLRRSVGLWTLLERLGERSEG